MTEGLIQWICRKIPPITETEPSIDLSPAMFHSFTKQYRGEGLQKKRLIVKCIPLACGYFRPIAQHFYEPVNLPVLFLCTIFAKTKIAKGERRDKRQSCLWFDYVEPSPILVITNLSCHFLHPPK